MIAYIARRRRQAVGNPGTTVPEPPIAASPHGHTLLFPAWLGAFAFALAPMIEPALANKFETISSGVSGSTLSKRDWLRGMLFLGAALSVLGCLAAIFMPRRNAHYLNYTNWKASAAVLASFAVVLVTFGLMV